jgi:nitroimidazol reductase NimA-like FMN-containing flavoprotein (pyridoxamine 5'-phosphate oxidase superfamily)
MDTEQFAAIQGIEMDEESAEALLRREGVGVLSLADDGLAYGVPVSFGYADRSIYFVFLRPGEDSEKIAFAGATREASFLAFTRPSRHNWQSVIARGPLHRLDEDEWDALVDAMADNAWFPSLFAETEPMQDLVGYELRVDSLTGMQSKAAARSA